MNFLTKIIYFILLNCFLFYGYQPQLGSLPRWSEGVGLQGGYSFVSYDKDKIKNQTKNQIYNIWLEQTYSFTKEVGVTIRQSYFYESEIQKGYSAFYLTVPFKYFFDSRQVARNFFLNPTLVYSDGAESLFGGGVLGYFNETFRTYFVTSIQTMWQLSETQNFTRSFEGDFEWAAKSDLGYHFIYDRVSNSGLWGLMRIQFHEKKNKRSHFTLQPSIMGYFDSLNIIARIIVPVWQNSQDGSSRDYGLSIGIASAW